LVIYKKVHEYKYVFAWKR